MGRSEKEEIIILQISSLADMVSSYNIYVDRNNKTL